MAILTTIICSSCHRTSSVQAEMGQPMPTICHECAQLEHEKKKKAFLEGRESMPIADRLAALESSFYDLITRGK